MCDDCDFDDENGPNEIECYLKDTCTNESWEDSVVQVLRLANDDLVT